MISAPEVILAQSGDALAIAQLSRDTIEQGLDWRWTRSRVLGAIHDRSTNVAVMQHAGELLGFGIMGYGERKAHLSLLAVRPGHRRRGLGAQLLAWLEKSAVVAGIERIALEARQDNQEAIAFYAAQGFRDAGTMPGYYEGRLAAVRLEKMLRAEAA